MRARLLAKLIAAVAVGRLVNGVDTYARPGCVPPSGAAPSTVLMLAGVSPA